MDKVYQLISLIQPGGAEVMAFDFVGKKNLNIK